MKSAFFRWIFPPPGRLRARPSGGAPQGRGRAHGAAAALARLRDPGGAQRAAGDPAQPRGGDAAVVESKVEFTRKTIGKP